MRNRLLVGFLGLVSLSCFANPGFIQHKIINQTNQNFNFILRQTFTMPLLGCSDNIPAHSEKTCSGEFDNNNGIFLFDFFTNNNIQSDIRITSRIRGISNTQTLSLSWTITPKGNDDFDVKVSIQ